MRRLAIAVTLAVITTAGATVWAGARYSRPATIWDQYDGRIVFSGSLGATRNNTDTASLIGCDVSTSRGAQGSWREGRCFAYVGGRYVACYTFDPQMIDAIAEIDAGAYLWATVATSGECDHIDAQHASYDDPPRP